MARSESPKWLEAMRRDWDARARENPRAYINWPDIPDQEEAFFASGRADYAKYVGPFLGKMQIDPRGKTALEIGCGIGRLSRCLAEEFSQVIGVDVSPEMVAKASSYGLPGLTFRAVSGGDLAGIKDSSVDFVLSFAVFQHVPDKNAILRYFEETARVLRRGGFFRLHLKGLWTLALGRWLIEAGFSEKRGRLSKLPFVRLRYLDTWQGRSVPLPEAREACRRCGLEVLDVESPWTNMMWLGGRKR
jgi:cyclopropane fatty-acyl-phospholipid synthase-like methyltransferase